MIGKEERLFDPDKNALDPLRPTAPAHQTVTDLCHMKLLHLKKKTK